MSQITLHDDVELLLEKSTLVGHYDVRGDNGDLFTLQGIDATIVSNIEKYELVHSQAASLRKLYFQSNKDEQASITGQLIDSLPSGGQIARTAALALIEVGNLDKLIATIDEQFVTHSQYGYHATTMLLNAYVHYFWSDLTTAQVKKIRLWAKKTLKGENELGKDMADNRLAYAQIRQLVEAIYNQTTHILTNELEDRINNGYNPEINEDKEKIKEEVIRFGFPADLSETLDKIDLKLSQAQDAFDFKGCMDLIRAFTERLYRSILDSYGERGKKIDEKDSEEVAKFFVQESLVSRDFANMVTQQRHLLSNLGSHRLKSREEDARLSKNMVIEMSLYILRRFENH